MQINRLREEGLRKIKEQEELLRQRMKEQSKELPLPPSVFHHIFLLAVVVEEDEDFLPSLKVTWKAKKNDPSNGGYSLEVLQDIFTKVKYIESCDIQWYLLIPQQFGVHHILVSRKRNGKAIISFHSALDAVRMFKKNDDDDFFVFSIEQLRKRVDYRPIHCKWCGSVLIPVHKLPPRQHLANLS